MRDEYTVGFSPDPASKTGGAQPPVFVGRLLEADNSPGVSANVLVGDRIFDGQMEWDLDDPVLVCEGLSRMNAEIGVLVSTLRGPIEAGLALNRPRVTELQRSEYARFDDLASGCIRRIREVRAARERGEEHPPPLLCITPRQGQGT